MNKRTIIAIMGADSARSWRGVEPVELFARDDHGVEHHDDQVEWDMNGYHICVAIRGNCYPNPTFKG